jgi:hypothetical protein
MNHQPLVTITDTVGDALSTAGGIVHDVGTVAVERASDLASSAAQRIPELPGPVNRLTGRTRRRFYPSRTGIKWLPLLIVAAGAIVVVVAWMRRSHTVADERAAAVPSDYAEPAPAAAVAP